MTGLPPFFPSASLCLSTFFPPSSSSVGFFKMIWGEEGNKHLELGWRCRQELHIGKQEPEGQHAGTEETWGAFWI